MKTRILYVAIGVGLLLAVAFGGSGMKRQDQPFADYGQGVGSYQVIRGATVDDLEKAVTEKLTEAWRPIGGVTVDSRHGYLQAMVLPE